MCGIGIELGAFVLLLHNTELLNGEIFTTLKEAQIVIEGWRQHYNRVRPHSSLGYKPPAPEIVAWPAHQLLRALRRPWRRVRP